MAGSPTTPHTAVPAELQERFEAERRGIPFLLFATAGAASGS